MSRIISKQELLSHRTRGDLWIVVHGYVFDVSTWMESHPGGYEILLKLANDGEDGGQEFEEIKHGVEARNIATSKYLIGRLEGSANKPFPKAGELVKVKGSMATSSMKNKPTGDGDSSSSIALYAIGFSILAIGGYYLYKKKQ